MCFNLAKNGNKGKCQLCISIRCEHVKQWDIELKNEVLGKNEDNNKNDASKEDEDKKEDEDVENIEENKSDLRLKFPPLKATQVEMRRADDQTYDEMTHLVSEYVEGSSCIKHNNSWDQRCPIENNWIYKENVKIGHSKFSVTFGSFPSHC